MCCRRASSIDFRIKHGNVGAKECSNNIVPKMIAASGRLLERDIHEIHLMGMAIATSRFHTGPPPKLELEDVFVVIGFQADK